jgi:hypothetical protein
LTAGNTTGGTDLAVSTGDDITFADNSKAIFGAGSDLQIYHDGSNSYIKDDGTGDLIVSAANLQIIREDTTQQFIRCFAGDRVELYHAGNKKLGTTATGIDVTGTVTADGLTVDTSATGGFKVEDRGAEGAGVKVTAYQGTTNSNVRQLDVDAYQLTVSTGPVTGTTVTDRLLIADNGDISFYEDTGTTPKLVWKSADERLGIGTSSPEKPLHVNSGTGNIGVRVESSDATASIEFMDSGTTSTATSARVGGISNDFFVQTNGLERLRIDSLGGITAASQAGGHVVFNSNTVDADFRVAYNNGTHALYVDGATGKVGIGTSSPADYADGGDNFVIYKAGDAGMSIVSSATGQGGIYFADGTSAADTTRGRIRYNHADNSMGFRVNNSEAAVIDSSGNVGISNSIPSSFNAGANNLVVGSGSGSEGITIYGGGESNIFFADGTVGSDAYVGRIEYSHTVDNMLFYVNNSNAMTLDANSNVGIGTALPSAALDVEAASPVIELTATTTTATTLGAKNNRILLTSNSTTAGAGGEIVFNTSDSTTGRWGAISGHIVENSSGAARGDIVFATKATTSSTSLTEAMRIDARGVVGINAVPEAWDAAFSSVLQVGAMSVLTSGGDNARIFGNAYYDGGATYKRINTGPAQAYEQTTGQHRWYNAASGAADSTFTWSESMRIDASGNLLVGCTSAMGGGGSDGINGFGVEGSGGGRFVAIQNTTDANMYIAKNSGYTNSNFILFYAAGTQVGGIVTNGTTTTYNTSSDQRLKDNIVDAPSASDDIDAIQVRSFDWKADGSHQKYGMVAQELLEVAPEAVSAPEDPEEMMGVDYSKLVPMMLKEIQSLRARIAALES